MSCQQDAPFRTHVSVLLANRNANEYKQTAISFNLRILRPGLARYLVNFKRGDYVDIVVDPSMQKGGRRIPELRERGVLEAKLKTICCYFGLRAQFWGRGIREACRTHSIMAAPASSSTSTATPWVMVPACRPNHCWLAGLIIQEMTASYH